MRLFLTTWLLGGAGAVIGSMIGAALGNRALFVGAWIGGIIASVAAVRVAEWRGWITRQQRALTMIGAVVGFTAAAIIAMNTLSSPIGPAFASLLIGAAPALASRR